MVFVDRGGGGPACWRFLWVRYDLAERVDDQPVYQIINDDYTRTVAIPSEEGLTQAIQLKAGQTLYGVRLNVTNYDHAFSTGWLTADLYRSDGTSLTTGSLGAWLLRDNTFETVIFEQPYTPAQDETLELRLHVGGFSGMDVNMPLGLWASDGQVGAMELSEQSGPLNATLAIQYVVNYSGSWSGKMLVVPGILILAAVAAVFWLLFGRTARPVLAVAAAGLFAGRGLCAGHAGRWWPRTSTPTWRWRTSTRAACWGQPVTAADGQRDRARLRRALFPEPDRRTSASLPTRRWASICWKPAPASRTPPPASIPT